MKTKEEKTNNETEFVNKLINDVIQLRLKRNLSQSELSRISSVPQKTISRMENRLSIPSIKTIFKLVDAMNSTIAINIGDEKEDCY